MQVTFLLGPAGSGKSTCCLREISEELKRSPGGAPLVLLAPRQATFQLERALLADPDLPGFTRLQILSFDRLASLVMDHLAAEQPALLREEGRVMVMRALLAQRGKELKIFHSTARLPGFARQLSAVLAEFQRHQLSADQLLKLAEYASALPRLPDKLHDLALLFRSYLGWLTEHELLDPSRLLDVATEAISQSGGETNFRLAGLWLDGFADLTPQELNFLTAVIPRCERATLAFCLEKGAAGGTTPLSMWGNISQSYQRCWRRLSTLPGCELATRHLNTHPATPRFAGSPVLAHLERHWSDPVRFPHLEMLTQVPPAQRALHIYRCPNPEMEAVAAAREILAHVREKGGRYRDIGVLVRSLEPYAAVIRRVFHRYGIPFFLDRREPIAHHPLGELTRYALRTVLFNWEADDWFGALKTGLVWEDEGEIDDLENAALAHGWRGGTWLQPLELPNDLVRTRRLERLREQILPPFCALGDVFQASHNALTGEQLAAAIRQFWAALRVDETLTRWSESSVTSGSTLTHAQIHLAALEEMQRWLEDLELAFAHTPLSSGEWLSVMEAGLASLSVGVVPLALDQVLVGAVDRSRNPNLELLVILGMNEACFPQVPPAPVLLTAPERAVLVDLGISLDPDQTRLVAQENYLGYIACTRASQRLALTYACRDLGDGDLNPSPFIRHLQRLFPGLEPETIPAEPDWHASSHLAELLPSLVRNHSAGEMYSGILARLVAATSLQPVLSRLVNILNLRREAQLSAGQAARLYGKNLAVSVSALEEYAACPFRFYVVRGLKAGEREVFEVDRREGGHFEHEVLMRFHLQLQAERKRWRQITPAEAKERIRALADLVRVEFRNGLFDSTPDYKFLARMRTRHLERMAEVLVGWAQQYQFEPTAVELSFGAPDGLEPWRINLGEGRTLTLRGRIDRIDLLPTDEPDTALAVVIDYKSGGQQLKQIHLEHGLDLQLLAYLGVLQESRSAKNALGHGRLIPAGAFYVGVRGDHSASGGTDRTSILDGAAEARLRLHQHRGRFRSDLLKVFDARPEKSQGDQFRFSFNKNGDLSKKANEALSAGEFARLVEGTRERLAHYGREIMEGQVGPAPYQISNTTACDYCKYTTICRFDPWQESFRILKPLAPGNEARLAEEAAP